MTTDLTPRAVAPRPVGLIRLARVVLTLDLLALLGCLVLATLSWNDTSSSTASLGIAVAVVLAVPFLVSAAMVLQARRMRLRTDAWTLVVLGSVVTFGLLGLVSLQLLFGS